MWGIIKFNYNDSNHSINLDETYFKNLSGNEVLKYKHYEILKEK